MQTTPASETRRRRTQDRDLHIVLALMSATLLVFGITDLDMRAAGLFFRAADPGNAWPYAEAPLWRFLYHAAPLITGALGLTALLGLLWGTLRQGASRYRRYGLLVLLAILVGPGLVVNVGLKDHWGRPRPRQVAEFGGRHAFRHVHQPGPLRSGKSFPCGHCSVGFVYGVFYFLLRRTRRGAAAAVLAGSILFGGLLGVGRMAAGGHFLSDILWAGYLVFLTNWLLYYVVLRVPQREASAATPDAGGVPRVALPVAGILLTIGLLCAVLLATPFDRTIEFRFAAGRRPAPGTLSIAADTANIDVHLVPGADPVLQVAGEAHGFGLPLNRLADEGEWHAATGSMRYTLRHIGIYTERDTHLEITVDAGALTSLVVRLDRGNIRVTSDGPLPPRLVIDAKTGKGRALLPSID